jgi:Endonuclease/Exonuclease/phosphatase family
MRLLCLNTWGGRLLDPLLTFLRNQREGVDVIALQEVFDGKVPLAERAGVDRYAGTNLPVTPDLYRKCITELKDFRGFLSQPYSSLGERLATFTRDTFTVGEAGQVELHSPLRQEAEGTPFRTHSIAQYVQLSRGRTRVRVMNTHGLWIGGEKLDTPERIHQSERINAFLSTYREPTVLCGDFNLLPGTRSLQILEKSLRNLVNEFQIPTTRSRLTPESKGKFADYVFVTPTLQVIDFRALDVLISDHLPLMLELSE